MWIILIVQGWGIGPPRQQTKFKDRKMKKNFQITIYPMTAKKDIKEAKEVVKAIKKPVNGSSSALECMELDTYNVYHVTTFSKKNGELQRFNRPCDLHRVTPLQIEVKVQYGKTTLEVSWYTEGSIDDKSCFAEIHTLASWEDGWYKWFDVEDDGTPKAPLAEVFIAEASM